ncbi:MAG: starch-binding protein, partial [Muribaculaceae bacterium]|nr:starch-binding protein [Muribaculaceae bacterium]
VKFALADGETKCYFSLTDFVGSSWDNLNTSANRYGAANEGDAITVGTPASITKYTNGVNASACKAWTIAPGTYDISVDLAAMTIILTQAGTEPEPGPDPNKDVYVYYEGPWTPTIYVYNNDKDSMTSWDEAPAMLLYEAPATLSRAADDKYYYYKLPEAYRSAYVIFKNGDDQYPAAQEPGLKMEGKSRIFCHDTKTWEEFDGPTSAIGQIAGDRQDATISCSGRTLSVTGLTGGFVLVAGIDGRICYSANAAADFSLDLAPGVYIVRTNSQTTRVAVR